MLCTQCENGTFLDIELVMQNCIAGVLESAISVPGKATLRKQQQQQLD